jgi:acyl-CoA dehydrogenase
MLDQTNTAMDGEVFAAFMTQLSDYVPERLVPAKKTVIETGYIADDILDKMPAMGCSR